MVGFFFTFSKGFINKNNETPSILPHSRELSLAEAVSNSGQRAGEVHGLLTSLIVSGSK